jgi:hypothetical protein
MAQRGSSRRSDGRSSNDQNPSVPTNAPSVASDTNRQRQDFWNVQMRLVIAGQAETISLCGRCAALTLASDRSQKLHKAFHEQIDGLDQRR